MKYLIVDAFAFGLCLLVSIIYSTYGQQPIVGIIWAVSSGIWFAAGFNHAYDNRR